MTRILAAVDRFYTACGYVSGFAILLIVLMQIVEIFLRNAFNVSLPFVWEYASYFHACAVFLGAAFALRCGGHIRVTMLAQVMPRAFETVATAVGLAISAVLAYGLVRFAVGFGTSGRLSSTVNEVPLVWPASVMAFGAVMLCLELLLRLLRLALGRNVETGWMDGSAAE